MERQRFRRQQRGGPYVAAYNMLSQISRNNGLTLAAIHQSIQGGHLMRNGF